MKTTEQVLRDLTRPSNVSVRSTADLVRGTSKAATKDDEQRKDKGNNVILRRKPELRPISNEDLGPAMELAPWSVLHTLGRGITLDRKGAARGLAEHWGCLKYSQALTGNPNSFMAITAEAKATAGHYKTLQSKELGVGLALTLATRLLGRRHPDHFVSIVPAGAALSAGWALRGIYRPDFFAEVWRPGEPSLVVPIACKGTHGRLSGSHVQLASNSAHVEAVHIGTWNETPCLVFSTVLSVDAPLTIQVLEATGSGGRLVNSTRDLNGTLKDRNIPPGIQPPDHGGNPREPEPGYHVRPGLYGWFQHVLARTAAAGLTAFTGDTKATASYLTKRQGKQRFSHETNAVTDSVQDARHRLHGMNFVGTDHVFRLNGKRVEAFSGVDEDLVRLLEQGKLERYRREVHARRHSWPGCTWAPDWDGPVSIHPDGSVLAMRTLRRE